MKATRLLSFHLSLLDSYREQCGSPSFQIQDELTIASFGEREFLPGSYFGM